jgi:FkbM family methyltransferase
MVAAKSVRFFANYAGNDPLKFVQIIKRRSIEYFSSPPSGRAVTRIGDINYEIDMSLHRLMRKYFFQTHEMFLERIFDKHLSSGNIFIDIGSNCGYWSAQALARIGQTGTVHAFEPVPAYFTLLRRLQELNPKHTIVANNFACGAKPGRFPMATVPPRAENFDNYNTNIGSSSLQPGFLDHEPQLTEIVEVDVLPFDQYVEDHCVDLDRIGLVKIDVEGFELPVLEGMQKTLTKPGRKIPVLCEILTDPNRRHPLDGRRVIEQLETAGYQCLNATNLRPIDRNALGFEENILCV